MKGKLNDRNKVITVKTEKMFLESLVKENQTKILNSNFTNDDPQINPVRMKKVVVGTRLYSTSWRMYTTEGMFEVENITAPRMNTIRSSEIL